MSRVNHSWFPHLGHRYMWVMTSAREPWAEVNRPMIFYHRSGCIHHHGALSTPMYYVVIDLTRFVFQPALGHFLSWRIFGQPLPSGKVRWDNWMTRTCGRETWVAWCPQRLLFFFSYIIFNSVNVIEFSRMQEVTEMKRKQIDG